MSDTGGERVALHRDLTSERPKHTSATSTDTQHISLSLESSALHREARVALLCLSLGETKAATATYSRGRETEGQNY
jgi:hypothetical protein